MPASPEPTDLTQLPLEVLDALGVIAADGTDVEIVDTHIDHNAEHGVNTEEETTR